MGRRSRHRHRRVPTEPSGHVPAWSSSNSCMTTCCGEAAASREPGTEGAHRLQRVVGRGPGRSTRPRTLLNKGGSCEPWCWVYRWAVLANTNCGCGDGLAGGIWVESAVSRTIPLRPTRSRRSAGCRPRSGRGSIRRAHLGRSPPATGRPWEQHGIHLHEDQAQGNGDQRPASDPVPAPDGDSQQR